MKTILLISLLFTTSIYNIHFNTNSGEDKSVGTFQGKKILIVNIATTSDRVIQLEQLQELYNQYHDQLEIIAFPSNSFNNEPGSDSDIQHFCDSAYHITFTLAAKASVAGGDAQPIYNWLAHQSDNGAMDGVVLGDFEKFLINENGMLIGVYASAVSPLDSSITNVITN